NLALHRPAIEWRIVRLGACLLGVVRPFGLGIEDNHVGEAADCQCASAFQAEQSGGLRAEKTQYAAQRKLPFLVKPAKTQAQCGLKARDSVGSVFKLDFL